ncbi:hypothetical protein C8J57DRAFT_1513758 [Mycena rebaudengoi]|nr:hypothetical protein C8J57DRAFT_1513758 [Mycena rebaudengoi]
MATLSLNICNIQPQSPEHLQGKVLPACMKAIPAHATGKFSTDQLSSITTPKHNVTQASSGGEVASRTSTTILEDCAGVLQEFQPWPAAEQECSLVEHAVKPMLAHILRFLVDEIHKTEVDEVPGHVSDASNRIRQQFQSTLETLLSREATPYGFEFNVNTETPRSSHLFHAVTEAPRTRTVIEHRDFSNRLLVQVFKADEVVNVASAARFARWAVTMPLSTGFIRKGHQCNLVGSLHGVIRFEKNHGTSPTMPYISVIEAVPLGGMEYPIILLVDTFLVNAHFTKEKTPNLIYKAMHDGWRCERPLDSRIAPIMTAMYPDIYIPGPATCSMNSGEDEGHDDRESIPEDHEQQINLDRIQVWAEAVSEERRHMGHIPAVEGGRAVFGHLAARATDLRHGATSGSRT